jgi:hypothetical protein
LLIFHGKDAVDFAGEQLSEAGFAQRQRQRTEILAAAGEPSKA